MLALDELLTQLEYNHSPHYRDKASDFEPETVHLFRSVKDLKVNGHVDGIYVFETSPAGESKILAAQPIVFMATANTETDARQIHRSIWNLCYAPFLIVRLPHQIRIYTGFNYSYESEKIGLLDIIDSDKRLELLLAFSASAINTGAIWKSNYANEINPDNRVDKRLLSNLKQLGEQLQLGGLRNELAHALIGKYVYISYLRHRNILSDEWLEQQQIYPQDVFTFRASISNLRKLNDSLEARFNGKIFPIDFDKEITLRDEHVSWVASVFMGDRIEKGDAPEPVRQLHLPFKAYDFEYIPVETLSAIYEQFMHDKKQKGAIYTPEILADYLISEVEWAKPLKEGVRVLDPACGSGVFLVLIYRRIIEKEIKRLGRKLQADELREILLESIYGIEREQDACFVTEFSLILMLLHYVEPPELHKNLDFQFPALHNRRIFHCDFFDSRNEFYKLALRFDWVIGNPPWVPADQQGQLYASNWVEKNKLNSPVGDRNVAEAFSWKASDLLDENGFAGIIIPATSLVNHKSKRYRQQFFKQKQVLRITNFANLRDILFDKRGTLPAATIIYRNQSSGSTSSLQRIIHYGPFSINQVSDIRERPWVITVNENEIKVIEASEAQSGDISVWKLALWGSNRDKRALERLRYLFPKTLEGFCEELGWGKNLPREGIQLRDNSDETLEKLEFDPNLQNLKEFDSRLYNKITPRYRFSISPHVLVNNAKCYLRSRGGKSGLQVNKAPHLILSASWQNYAIYSEEDFIVPPRQSAISAPEEPVENKDYLKALTVYMSSSLVAYYLFFNVPQWGIFSQRDSVVTSEIRKVPIPNITLQQAHELANLHGELVEIEQQEIARLTSNIRNQAQQKLNIETDAEESISVNPLGLPNRLTTTENKVIDEFLAALQANLQTKIDQKIKEIFRIPDEISLLSEEFVRIGMNLDKPSAINRITSKPSDQVLLDYIKELRDELDSFAMGRRHYRVTINYSNELIECVVEITNERKPIPINNGSVQASDKTLAKHLAELSEALEERFSQWVYVQRSLRLFDGPRIYIYKPSRLIDWTRTQALQDANDIIGTILTAM